jgi:hypothetical protein
MPKQFSESLSNIFPPKTDFPPRSSHSKQTIEILVLERVCLSCSCKHFGRKKHVKSLLISTLDKIIYYIGTFLQGSTKPLFTSQNRMETSWKNSPVFFNMLVLDLDFYGANPKNGIFSKRIVPSIWIISFKRFFQQIKLFKVCMMERDYCLFLLSRTKNLLSP